MPLHILNLCHGISEVMNVAPRTGRPPKNEKSKNVSLQLRITEKTAEELKECSEILGISRTEVIEKSVEEFHRKVEKK